MNSSAGGGAGGVMSSGMTELRVEKGVYTRSSCECTVSSQNRVIVYKIQHRMPMKLVRPTARSLDDPTRAPCLIQCSGAVTKWPFGRS